MEPSNAPQDDPPPRSMDKAAPSNQTIHDNASNDLSDSLNRLSLANAMATPLPASPSLLSPRGAASRSPVNPAPSTPRRTPSLNSLRDERRKSTPLPILQKRQSTASLRSVSNQTIPPSPRADSSRRSSATIAGSPTTAATPAIMPPRLAQAPEGPTAASIAAEHFQKEVDLHQMVDLGAKTTVLVHDACYGHRFSRPRASKTQLSNIFERPERIRACVVGIAAAYVRLGRRHAGEKFAPHPNLDLHSLPPPFQMRKTSRTLPLTNEAVTNVHGTKWMADLNTMCDVAESRLALTGNELVRPPVQGEDGQAPSKPPLHSGDLYLCSESINAFEGALGGVCDGIDAVFGPSLTSRAFVCIRPPGHHCSADFPSGFCWINNVHVGVSYAATNHGLTHAAILDFDLHHGDGSQEIAADHNYKAATAPRNSPAYKKATIGYFSLHDINSYPCEAGEPEKVRNASVCIDGAHNQHVWNVHLQKWTTEAEFWDHYETKYRILIDKARAFLRHHTERLYQNPHGPQPKATIFISAGFDANQGEYAGMQRHGVNVPTGFYARFTADVVRMSEEDGLGVNGRVISVLEGGYSDRALTSGVLSHLSGFGTDSTDDAVKPEGLSDSVLWAFDKLSTRSEESYDPAWWSENMLTELEAVTSPPPKDDRERGYWKETRSSSAKKVTTPRKSFGSSIAIEPNLQPLPEVGWATAAHELSKILIPETRQTTSYRSEELNAEASRQRRERQIALDGGINPDIIPPPPPTPIDEKRQLRARKSKSPTPFYSPRVTTSRQQAMQKGRRTTINSNDVSDPTQNSPTVAASRRKSTSGVAPVEMTNLTSSTNGNEKLSRMPSSAASIKSTASIKSKTGTVTGLRKPKSRPETPKRSSSPKKTPPVPKVPNVFLESDPPAPQQHPPPPPPSDDVENLTSGLKRIKLVMSSAGDRKADRADRAADQAASEEKPREERKVSRGRSPRKPSSSTRTPRSKSAVSTKSTPTTPKSAPAKAKSARGTTPPLPVPPVGLGVGVNVGAADENKEKFPMGLDGAPDMARVILPWEMTTEKATETSIAEPMYSASKPAETMTPSLPTTRPVESNYVSTGISQPHTPEMATMPDASTLSYPNTFSPATTAAYTKQGLPVFTSSSPIPFAPTDQQPRTQPLPQLPLQESAHQPRHVPNDEDSPLQAPPPPPIVNNFSQNPRFYSQ